MTGEPTLEIPITSQSKTPMNTNSDQIKEIQANKKRLLDQIKSLEEQEAALKKYNGFKLGDWVCNVYNNFTYQIMGFGEYNNEIYAESTAQSQEGGYFTHSLIPATDEQIIKVLEQRAKDAGIVVGAKFIDKQFYCSARMTRQIESIQYGTKKGGLDKKHDSSLSTSFLDKNGWVIAVRGNNGHVNSHDNIEIIKEEPLPKINGYDGTYDGEFFVYGCAKIEKSIIENAYKFGTAEYLGNRYVENVDIKLNSGVSISWKEIKALNKVIKEYKS